VKNIILTFLQLPLCAVLCLVVFAEFLLTKCLLLVENPLSHPLANTVVSRNKKVAANQDEQIREAKKIVKRTRYRAFLATIMRFDDDKVDAIRESLESLGVGCAVVTEHTSRHLYAVLKPSRRENLQRIQNVMRALDPYSFEQVLRIAKKRQEY